MVKNLNTIDRSERVRIGKHVPNEQAVNTIIINASSNVIEASQEGFYVAPVRLNESLSSNVMCYDISTKEIVDSGKTIDLQGVTETGNTTTETVQFTNNTTSFVTTSNVGIANTNPQHELSVGGDVYIEGNLTVLGETTAISSENLRVKDAIVELGENNTDSDFVFDLGLIMTRPGSNVTASYIESSNEYIIGYTQNSASDTYITPDASNLIQMRVYGDVTANSFIGDGSFLSNVIQDTDLEANLTIIRGEMAANTLTLRDDLQSNATILRGEMAANTLTLRDDLQSNATILRGEMAANTLTLRDDLQSNATILRGEMAANTLTLRADLQSNISISESTLRGEMAANTLTLRDDLQSNATILRGEMAANTLTLRDDLQSNATILRGEMAANTVTLRGDLQSNASILRGEMAANTVTLRADLQSNIAITESTLRGEMAANTVTLRNEIALKSNINNPVFTGIITGDGGGISNISLQHVTEYGDSTDRTITMSNALSLITSGNVGINTPTPQKMLHVAGEILADDDITGVDFYGDDATFTGSLSVSGDTLIYGDLEVRGNTTHLSTQNLLVEDPILALGANNTSSSLDTGLIVLVYQGNSNVAFGYRGASNEFIISHTLSSPDDSELIPDTSNAINVHVYGDVTADTFRGDGGFLSNIASNLHQIVLNGNTTSETVYLENAITGLEVSNNVLVGGNVTANFFSGDGGLLSNLASTLQEVSDNGNTTSNTLQFTNSHTAFTTDLTSNVGVKLDQLSNVVITSPQTDHLLVYDGSDWVNEYNIHNFIKVHNTTGSTLYRGNVVYIVDSFNNNVANVALAKSDSSSTMPAIGLIHEDIANGQEGSAVAYGKVNGINTSGYIEGQTVYVSNVGAGLIMNSKPYGLTDQIQNVGICIKSHQSNGVIFVTGVGRSNDIPNAPISVAPNYVYVNETNNDMKKIAPSDLLTKLQTLEQVVNTGNTVSNSIEITGNLTVSQNVSIGGITANHFPIVGADGYLRASTISTDNGATVIASNLEVTGDIIVSGNSYVIESNSVVIEDRVFGIANNNTSHTFDVGIIMEHPGKNIALIHHGEDGDAHEHEFTIGYTQNTITDNSITDDTSNLITVRVVGNLVTQNNMTVDSGGSYFGDGTTLTGVALETDLVSNVSRISVLETDLASNATRVGVLETDLASNATRVGVLETDLASNATRVGVLETDLASNATRVGILETDLASNASRVSVLETDLASNASRVSVLETDLASNATRVGVLETDLASNATRVGVLETDLASNATRVGVLETDLASNAARVGVLETDLASNASRVSVLETDLASNATRVGVLETDLASNASRIGVLELQDLNDIVNIGNSTSNTILLTNADVGLVATGNIQANYFIGDGSGLDNIASNLEEIVNNGNVASNTIQLTNADVGLVATGNVEAARFIGDGSYLTGLVTTLEDVANNGNTSANTIQLTNADVGLVATGNIQANYFIGDGSQLDNIASNLEEIVLNGNVTTQTIHIENVVSLTTTGNVGIANTNPTCDLAIGSNVCFNDTSSNILTVDGNILAHRMTLDSIQIASVYALEYVTMTGNTTSNTVEFTNSATGLVTTANVGVANSSPIHTLDVGSNLWVDDIGSNVLYVNGNVHVAGSQLTTDGKVGIGNTAPGHDLSVASNLYVDDVGSNVLVVNGNASIGTTLTLGAIEITPAYTLEEVSGQGNVTSNVIQFTNSNVGAIVTGGLVVNDGSYACKHYAYSNVSVPTDFANVAMTFASNVFHAKITAQLTHGNEEVSTMVLDVQGGTRDGTTSSLDIATGVGSVFGNTNTKPWSGAVSTTPTKVILEPSATGTTAYGVDVYIEYKSSSSEGKLESISIGTDTVKSFVY